MKPVPAGRSVRLRAAAADLVGAWFLYGAVKLILGSLRGEPYPDPAPITAFTVTYALYLLFSLTSPDRNTVGERAHSLVPMTKDGKRLSLPHCILRLFLLSFFWAGWILFFDTQPGNIDRTVIGIEAAFLAVVLLYGFVDAGLLFIRRTPRTLTDRVLQITLVY